MSTVFAVVGAALALWIVAVVARAAVTLRLRYGADSHAVKQGRGSELLPDKYPIHNVRAF
jgi:hypothetical protein